MGRGGMFVKFMSLLARSWSVANVVIVPVDVWSAGVPWTLDLSESSSSLRALSDSLSSLAILAMDATWAILSASPFGVALQLVMLKCLQADFKRCLWRSTLALSWIVPGGLTNVWFSGCWPGFGVVDMDAFETVEGLEDLVVDAGGAADDDQGALERVPEVPRELLAEFLPEECFFEVDVF